jgi:hypothetical protein
MDTVLNGDETDTDCGGSCPDPCPIGGECQNGSDCVDGVCEFNTCVQADCTDTVFNGDETDTDCGGSCVVDCVVGEMCLIGDDCVTGVCDPMTLLCAGAICTDMVLNGDETDVDCGGSCGATCEVGELCGGSGDCIEGVCEFGVCSMPDCGDGVENGDETDLDCGGSCGATCQPTDGCMVDGDCEQGVCDTMAGTCAFPACNDMVQNQDETDVDCGGICGNNCGINDDCNDGGDCASGACNPVTHVCWVPHPCGVYSCPNGITVFSVPPTYQSGALGTETTCHETTSTIAGGGCSEFVGGRTLSVNGQVMTCGGWTLPDPAHGGYCIITTAGDHSYASFTVW